MIKPSSRRRQKAAIQWASNSRYLGANMLLSSCEPICSWFWESQRTCVFALCRMCPITLFKMCKRSVLKSRRFLWIRWWKYVTDSGTNLSAFEAVLREDKQLVLISMERHGDCFYKAVAMNVQRIQDMSFSLDVNKCFFCFIPCKLFFCLQVHSIEFRQRCASWVGLHLHGDERALGVDFAVPINSSFWLYRQTPTALRPRAQGSEG